MRTLWCSIRPTAPGPSVVSYSIKIHSFCCLCYDGSVHSPFQSEFSTEVDMLLRISISKIFLFINFNQEMPTSSSSSPPSFCIFFSKVIYKGVLLFSISISKIIPFQKFNQQLLKYSSSSPPFLSLSFSVLRQFGPQFVPKQVFHRDRSLFRIQISRLIPCRKGY